ncbi:MAG TPA: GatB/YqeY domain-containing protein [Micromonosporaceae bacterium]|nr:GatB/YqeY domain-containing protein [Micromonosporaceae bacterium]
MTTFKDRLEADLRTAIKARDELVVSTLRMAIAAVRTEEVSGSAARTLTDQEVEAVLRREMKKRRDAATAFADAGRAEQAERERHEERVLEAYLPKQLSDEELAVAVTQALDGLDLSGKQAMGAAMKAAQAEVAGRAEGGRVAAEVRRQIAQ